jgi:hypothetical protein
LHRPISANQQTSVTCRQGPARFSQPALPGCKIRENVAAVQKSSVVVTIATGFITTGCLVERQSCIPPFCELGHNTVACAPSRLAPNHPWCWIASLIRRNASTHPALAFDVHSVLGRPAKRTAGLVVAVTHGTRSIREECARYASTTGLRRSVSRVPAGRHIPIGIRTDKFRPSLSAICSGRGCATEVKNVKPSRPLFFPGVARPPLQRVPPRYRETLR